MEIAILLSALFSNLLTKLVKGRNQALTYEEIVARRSILRGLNAFFGLLLMIAYAVFLGDPIDGNAVQGAFAVIGSTLVTFATSQGLYHITKS